MGVGVSQTLTGTAGVWGRQCWWGTAVHVEELCVLTGRLPCGMGCVRGRCVCRYLMGRKGAALGLGGQRVVFVRSEDEARSHLLHNATQDCHQWM